MRRQRTRPFDELYFGNTEAEVILSIKIDHIQRQAGYLQDTWEEGLERIKELAGIKTAKDLANWFDSFEELYSVEIREHKIS